MIEKFLAEYADEKPEKSVYSATSAGSITVLSISAADSQTQARSEIQTIGGEA
jgi:hypothetical protein